MVALHVLVGATATVTRLSVVALFYTAVLSFGPRLFLQSGIRNYLPYALVYLASFDVIGRMAGCSPLIPYELSKYLMLTITTLGILVEGSYTSKGLIMLLLLIPSLLFDLSGEVMWFDIVNNGLGPIILSLSVIYFWGKRFNIGQFLIILNLILYTSIMVLSFAYLKTPDYDDISFDLSANFQTSGGFGSNQVSTILGLGSYILLIYLLIGKKLTSSKYIDYLLLFGFVFQGLLTFSRGGMIGIVISAAIFIAYIYLSRKSSKIIHIKRKRVVIYILAGAFMLVTAFLVVDNLSNNALSLRYRGETAGTISGAKEKNINTLTSNRYGIFIGDLDLWTKNPLFGVGVGASKYLRAQLQGVVAHVELSRLLADHGMLGAIFFILWISLYFNIVKKNPDTLPRAIFVSLFILAIYTSFHASMRTYVTPLLTGLVMVNMHSTNTRNTSSKRVSIPKNQLNNT